MTATDVERLKQQLADQTGLDFGLLNRPALAGFVQRRSRELGLADDRAYHQLVSEDSGERERLIQEVSVAETWFFRYPASYQLLVDHASGLRRQGRDRLTLLSIACATGEEPYGMAMAAAEAGWPLDHVVVDAVDRHEASLAIARAACYRSNSVRETPPDWAQKWLRRADDRVHVDERIVSAVRFSCRDILNASSNIGPSSYDVVYCRNLFIYLGAAARTRLVHYLSSVLSPDGILFVGHAEHAILPSESFESAGVNHAFALRPKQCQPVVSQTPRTPRRRTAQPAARRKRSSATVPASTPLAQPKTEIANCRDITLADARALADAGQLKEALGALEAMDVPPAAGTEFFDLLGSVQLGLGNLAESRDTFQKVLYLDPEHEEALLQMAIVCDRLGNAKQAARYRRRAARAHREDVDK